MSSTSVLPQETGVPSPREYDLFVVHAEADRAWVDGFLKHALGLDPGRVMTPRDFRLGASVVGEFERGVASSRFTLLVLSPAFLADRWAEFGEGLVSFSAVDEGRNRLLALTLHPCHSPLRLRFRESLDCTDWTHWDDEAARLRRHLDAPEPTIEAVPCPFPGMVPFHQEDARFFHGRDEEIRQLLTLIRQHHFLAVIGSSGSGKSSLVTAGLLPKLDDPRSFPRGTWRVVTLRPGATPVDELARTLPGELNDPAATISATLAAHPSAQKLLLVVDQFEELFSQVKDASTRDAFIGHLKVLRADPRCTVILTMRADFYGDLMNSALWPIDKSQLAEVAALRGESLRQAIVKPAEAVGVYLEEGLVERLLADAADEPGSLPMLQEALVLLWGTMSGRLLTRASYDSLGRDGRSGLAVAMATKADATLAALPPGQQRIARRIFLRLVQFGEGRPDTRRQLGVDDLRAESDVPGVFDELLQKLIANRLLTPSPDEARGLRVDIAHEMLIIGWPASREWVQARRDAEKTRRRLAAKAEEWVRLGRGESGLLDPGELVEADTWLKSPDAVDLGIDADVNALTEASRRAIGFQKRRRRMWIQVAIGGLTAALVAISSLAFWGDLKRREAVRATAAAEKSAAEAKANAEEATANAEKAKANAADVLIEAGSTALAHGHSFDVMHRFAGAIGTMPGQSPHQAEVRQALGFVVREVPRLEAIIEHGGVVFSAAFSPDSTRIVTASADKTARVCMADTGTLIAKLSGHSKGVQCAAFSPDGSRIVTASDDKTARVWSADTGALLAELKGHAERVLSAAFSPDGTRIVTASLDRTARVWRADAGKLVAELKGHAGAVVSAAFNPDGTRIVTAAHDKTSRVWRADTGTVIVELKGHAGAVFSAAFNPDGTRIVTASGDRTARVWRADTGTVIAELKANAEGLFPASFSPDGTRIVTASFDTGRVWNAYTGTLIAELKGHTHRIYSAAFSPDSTRIVTASYDETARVWGADSGALLTELKGHSGGLWSAAFSPDGRRVVTTSYDKTARIWRLSTSSALLAELKAHADKVVSAAFSPEGARVVTASWDKTARVWSADTGTLIAELKGHADKVVSAAFSPEGARVVTASWDKTARVWSADTGTLIAELKGHADKVVSAAFSPEGARVVTASWDKTARVWSADTGALLAELKGHAHQVDSAAFSPDGTRVVTASWDKTARVWRADTGALLAELKGHESRVTSAAFSPDGSRIVTASVDSTERVWRTDTGALLAELKGHADPAAAVAFSPDGSKVVTASYDKTARVWSADTGTLIAELEGHADAVLSAAFSPDGSRIVTASPDKTARVWMADPGTLLAVLNGHAGYVSTARFSPDGRRIVTASGDGTARIWRFDAISGDASILSLWVEVLTGTELRGGGVQPLAVDAWNQRKTALQARGDKVPPEEWFKKLKPKTSDSPASAK